jgi:predicted ATP-dependent endonuclease of OLD family
MKLIEFSVTNFRSITKAYKVPFKDISILIGKNNEGKSNLLKALSIVMTSLRDFSEIDDRRKLFYSTLRSNESDYYVWERDFPISLQGKRGTKESIFRLEFDLNEDEICEFKNEIKSNLNGTLPIEIKIGISRKPVISVIKKGRGSKSLNSKSKKIAEYIAKRIHFNYIPAIRTENHAMNVVEDLTSRALAKLEEQQEYLEAIRIINDLQVPILDELSKKIKNSLCELLPNIKFVSIEFHEIKRRRALRQQFDVFIDDGNKTTLEFKGDGVKSLAAMALLKDMAIEKGGISLVAIEEPESHLHPGAIHILRETLYSLTNRNQVIVSTHNPLFVDRNNVSSNIIVESGKVLPAKTVKEIRDILGVRTSDNLQNANYVLVVEGEEDATALKFILPFLSEKLKRAIDNHMFIIEKIGGASKLSYKLSSLKNALCVFHVLLDNDEAGRKAFDQAEALGDLDLKDVTFVNCCGMPNSEFEDCLNIDVYKEKVEVEYGVRLDVAEFRNNNKWSDRMKVVFQTQGKIWTENIEAQVKSKVASSIKTNLHNSLNANKRKVIDELVISLEQMIK